MLGVGCTVHWVPSQRSAMMDGPPGPKTVPTAVHAEGEEQETLFRLSPFPSGVTGDCKVHAVPSHRSASIPVSVFPTAVQAEAEVHETAARK
jgi:hypothetical protein